MAAPLNFRSNLVLYAMCAAAAYFAWPWIKANFGPDTTPYTESGEYGGGSTGARNHTGVEPYGGNGHGGGYSPYFPGPRDGGGQQDYARRRQNLRLDPSATDDVEDRRGEPRGGRPTLGEARADEAPGDARGSGAACWDRVEHRRVAMSYCDSQGRR
jgi:hypothetical protein